MSTTASPLQTRRHLSLMQSSALQQKKMQFRISMHRQLIMTMKRMSTVFRVIPAIRVSRAFDALSLAILKQIAADAFEFRDLFEPP